MTTNEALQRNVQDALRWEPLLKAAEIGVTAKEGVITLTGTVDSYWKKMEAEDAAKNVAGVKAVVEKIVIQFVNSSCQRDDNEIARGIVNAFDWNIEVPNDKVHAKVEKGWVTLEGDLEWNFQKEAAYQSVRDLVGVIGVTNNIKIKSPLDDEIEKNDIESALGRNWSLHDRNIQVAVSGTKVTLTGTVDSWFQKTEAARIAWKAPGVWSVDNKLVVEYAYEMAG
jgi:osmotically-inducible protein OsmY